MTIKATTSIARREPWMHTPESDALARWVQRQDHHCQDCGKLIQPHSTRCQACGRKVHSGRKPGTHIETESDYLNGLLYNGMLATWVRKQLGLPATMCGVYGSSGGCAHCEYEIPAWCPGEECGKCRLECVCNGKGGDGER